MGNYAGQDGEHENDARDTDDRPSGRPPAQKLRPHKITMKIEQPIGQTRTTFRKGNPSRRVPPLHNERVLTVGPFDAHPAGIIGLHR